MNKQTDPRRDDAVDLPNKSRSQLVWIASILLVIQAASHLVLAAILLLNRSAIQIDSRLLDWNRPWVDNMGPLYFALLVGFSLYASITFLALWPSARNAAIFVQLLTLGGAIYEYWQGVQHIIIVIGLVVGIIMVVYLSHADVRDTFTDNDEQDRDAHNLTAEYGGGG